MASWTADRLVAEVERLAARGLSAHEFLWQAGERLRRGVAADGICWATLDPSTLLMTSVVAQDLVVNGLVHEDAVAAAGWQLLRSEYVVEDVNTAAALAAGPSQVGILSHATRGHPERSERYRQLLMPRGIPFELRGTLTSGGARGRASHCIAARHAVTSRLRRPPCWPASRGRSPTGCARRCARMPPAAPISLTLPGWWSLDPTTMSSCSPRQPWSCSTR